MQRELNMTKDDILKLKDQLKAKDERINVLHTQNQELMDSLRQQSD